MFYFRQLCFSVSLFLKWKSWPQTLFHIIFNASRKSQMQSPGTGPASSKADSIVIDIGTSSVPSTIFSTATNPPSSVLYEANRKATTTTSTTTSQYGHDRQPSVQLKIRAAGGPPGFQTKVFKLFGEINVVNQYFCCLRAYTQNVCVTWSVSWSTLYYIYRHWYRRSRSSRCCST